MENIEHNGNNVAEATSQETTITNNSGQENDTCECKKRHCNGKSWLCLLIAAVIVGACIFIHKIKAHHTEMINECSIEFQLDGDLACGDYNFGDEYFIYNTETGKFVTRHLSAAHLYEDSVVVAKKNGKVCFIDYHTGKITKELDYYDYDKYSEGLMAVVDRKGVIRFVDSKGELAFEASFPTKEDYLYGYSFSHGHCVMSTLDEKEGIIDTKGNWVVEPRYDNITSLDNGYFTLVSSDSVTVVDSNLNTVIPAQCADDAQISDNGEIIIQFANAPAHMYSADGKRLLSSSVYTIVTPLYWEEESDSEYTTVSHITKCLKYSVSYESIGLMDNTGHPLTEPIYSDIYAVNDNLFRALIPGTDFEVLLDSRGNIIPSK